ncbi:TonB-linked SusC/RagA family outer membrane protein [Catalinimonas alkaloidigena]|uniref:SusC/RagA family TonB-linked outer membrane protein n=1 Tax=Catalinimonas alkaloidigena TaxID=1075417 RepID=UPI002405B6B7|nr:TonB-dependent receptor [Catalinimonas alkaloidigena]MDF9799438.1 TonB-linked SusC/RagA family outer membrane protein [Catalinimonas alkaloidigena]
MRVNTTKHVSSFGYRPIMVGLLSLMIALFSLNTAWAQNTVSGTVSSAETGEALPGVNVIVKGTTVGTVTDIDGNYRLNIPQDATILVFSFIGLKEQEVTIEGRSTIDVEMAEDARQLSEIVVQAYGASSEALNTQQVETVDASAFENFPILSPQEALQGQAAGVQSTSSSGIIGSAQTVRVRGITSFTSGNSPLYVIDGVPLNDASGTDAYSSASGATPLNPLINLNPNDIESMTVLKDAAATSLYGSRGANGVILITTRKGKAGEKTQINFDYFTGINQPTVEKEVLNYDQYAQLREGLGVDPGTFPASGTDWVDIVRQTGKLSSYSLNASGGSEKTTFYVGGTYFNSESYVIGNEVDKLNGRLNLTHQANDRLKLGVNFATSNLKNDRISAENSTYSPWTLQYLNTPFAQAYDAEGNLQQAGFNNPLLLEDGAFRFDLTSRRNTGNAFAELDILEGLTFKTDWGMDYVQVEEEVREADVLTPDGYGSKEIVQDSKWLTTNTLNYVKPFGRHTINVLLGQSYEESTRDNILVEANGYISDDLPNTGSGSEPVTASNTGTGWAISSLFARLNYNFADRYIIEGNFRRDGSSRFGADKRYGNFGAVSASWLISEEEFFPENDVVNFLKLSSSYGSSGNDRIDNFGALGLYGGVNYNGLPGLYYSQPANPILTWETTSQFDVNINAHFLDSRLRVDASYWIKATDGILLDVPLPYTTGFPSRTQNFGEMENTGVDLSISGDILNAGDLRWTAVFNVGFLHNEVTKLPETAQVDPEGNLYVSVASFTDEARATEGKSANEFYLKEYVGINPETGDAEWVGEDGNPTTDYNAAPYAYAGSALPKATGGFTNTLSYKGLSLNVFFNFVSGGHAYIADNEFAENIAASGAFNNTVRVLDSWTEDNRDAFAPAYSSPTMSFWDNESTRHLFDASYIRLKNITLSYQLPGSLLENTNILRAARVYVMGQNLATFASDVYDNGSDPEVNNSGTTAGSMYGESFFTSPNARQVTVGVTLGF